MFASLHTSDYAIGHMPLRGTPRRLLARISTALAVRRQRAELARLPETLPLELAENAAARPWANPNHAAIRRHLRIIQFSRLPPDKRIT